MIKFESLEVPCLNESEQMISIRLVGMKDIDKENQRHQNFSLLRD